MQPATNLAAVTAISHSSQPERPLTLGDLSALPGVNFEHALADHISEMDNARQPSTLKTANTLSPDLPSHSSMRLEPRATLSIELKPTHGLPGGGLTKAPRLPVLPPTKEVPFPRNTAAPDFANDTGTARGSASKSAEPQDNPGSLLPAPKPDVHFDAAGLSLDLAGHVSAPAVNPGLSPVGSAPTAKISTGIQAPVLARQTLASDKSDVSVINEDAAQKPADTPAFGASGTAQVGGDTGAAASPSGFSRYLVSQPGAVAPPTAQPTQGAAAVDANGKAEKPNHALENGPVDAMPSAATVPLQAAHTPIGNQAVAAAAHQGDHIIPPAATTPSLTQASATFDESRVPGLDAGGPSSGPHHSVVDSVSVPVNPYQKLDQISGTPTPAINVGANRVAVGVHDPALGWVEIKSQSTAGQVAASFVTASGQTHEALTAQLPSLAQFLADHEVRVGSLTVEQQSTGGQAGDQAHAGYEQGSNSGHGGDGPQASFNAGPQMTAVEPGIDAGIDISPQSYISVLA